MADTQYLIDIAAKMAGGDATISQLAELENRLTNSGASVATLEKALAQAKTAMASTAAASAEANTALQAGQARYDALEKAAEQAAKALEKAGAATKGAVPIDLKQKADAAAAALKAEAASLDKTKAAASSAASAHAKAAGTVKQLESATKAAVASQRSLRDVLNSVGKGLAIGIAGAAGLAAGLGAMAVSAIHAKDEQEQVRAQFAALAGSAWQGIRAKTVLDQVADSAGVTDDQLAPLATKLLAIGTPVDQLGYKLKALAAQQALGLGGEEELLNMLGKLGEGMKINEKQLLSLERSTGITSTALADKLGISIEELRSGMKKGTLDTDKLADAIVDLATVKGMPALENQAKSLRQKIKNLEDGFGDMIAEAIDTDEAKGALDEFSKLFDKGSASGQQMRAEIGAAFKAVSAAAVAAAPIIVSAIKSIADAVSGLIKLYNDPSLTNLANLGRANKGAATVDTDAIATSKAGLAELEAKASELAKKDMRLQMNPFTAFSKEAEETATQLQFLMGEIEATKKALAEQEGASAAGADVAAGYAAGIRSGAGDVKSAAAWVAAQGQAALKAEDQSKSPSKKYEKLGTFVSQGYAGGISKDAPLATSALSRLTGTVSAGGAAPRSAESGKRVQLTGPFNFYGVRDADDAEARFEAMLTRSLEGDATQIGAGQTP